jgi:hypothetical protein
MAAASTWLLQAAAVGNSACARAKLENVAGCSGSGCITQKAFHLRPLCLPRGVS